MSDYRNKIQSDNTRVVQKPIVLPIKHRLRSNEAFLTDRNTGEKVLVKTPNATIGPDRRNEYWRQQSQNKAQQLYKQREEERKQKENMEALQGFFTFTLPSTYIGPVFNSNGKPYLDNVLSGQGSGSSDINLAIDLLTPFGPKGINKGIKTFPKLLQKPIQTGKTMYTSGKDLMWLAKTYNKVGTGLTNPYVRNKFVDLAKHPSVSRNFIETYSRSGEAGLNYSQIKEALPQLKKLQEEFNITPQMNFTDYETVAEQVGNLRNALQSAKNLNNRYIRELELLKDKNEVLYNIAKESPQYQQQIVSDLENGNITNVEEYVKNLIKQSNTFLRRMNLEPGQDFTEAFSKIRGRGKGSFTMDVGNPEVVFDPIWSSGYGNNVALYSPKEIKLEGPVETWWSQRKPRFQDKSIYIDTEGMHTGNHSKLYPSDIQYNMNKYIKSVGLPNSYNRTAAHMIFLSPNEGASIADQFVVTPVRPNIRYTLGYKNGGKLKNGR